MAGLEPRHCYNCDGCSKYKTTVPYFEHGYVSTPVSLYPSVNITYSSDSVSEFKAQLQGLKLQIEELEKLIQY